MHNKLDQILNQSTKNSIELARLSERQHSLLSAIQKLSIGNGNENHGIERLVSMIDFVY